ncbi:DUF1971 domain-containing protein [Synechococcus sp. CS-1329]|jgi:tellurite resistance-related uncharacterized protein|uniref:DUF1971 domain-containing protein n=1 Tax=Synechococcus sp. CS-1329 TaxID=2847975 RepID=UPI00223BD503|nr:DUF1971 domain-containing protein [Synechococcus sp. CS-1329]MCT0219144.1 DUF1971 domain-containing protein [Synechococcus sp. CS-1329]
MKSLPAQLNAYQRTPEFTELTTPSGLLHGHSTKESVWGRIVVLEGRLQYTIDEPEREVVVLDPDVVGVVEPAMLHSVRPLGAVRFYVEFYR